MQNSKRAVLDLGTGSIKAGWAGEGRARYVLPTCAGAVRRRPQLYLAEECYCLQEYICSRPSQGGLWANLEMLRDLIDVSFSRKYLGADPKELNGVALTEPLLTPAPLRHHVSEILFEDLGVERLAIVAAQAVIPYAFWGMGWGAQDICAPPRAKRMGVTCYSGPDGSSVGNPGARGAPVTKTKGGGTGTTTSSDPCFSPRLAAGAAATDLSSVGQVSPGRNPFGLTVDVGFSLSHAVPFVNYSALEASALRSEIGGAHANAYLKNLLLTRGLSLEKNELFAQKLKEETCFFAGDLMQVLKQLSSLPGGRSTARLGGPLFVERETPDYSLTKAQLSTYYHTHSPAPIPELSSLEGSSQTQIHQSSSSTSSNRDTASDTPPVPTAAAPEPPGVVQGTTDDTWGPPGIPTRPTVKLSTERLVVPEILFRPQDGGSSECGVAELVYRAICKAPVEAQPFLSSQIFLVGGSTKFWGFKERLWQELRGLLPEHWQIHIYQHEDPQNSAWLGASNWAHDDGVYMQFSVSRQQFLETGFI